MIIIVHFLIPLYYYFYPVEVDSSSLVCITGGTCAVFIQVWSLQLPPSIYIPCKCEMSATRHHQGLSCLSPDKLQTPAVEREEMQLKHQI